MAKKLFLSLQWEDIGSFRFSDKNRAFKAVTYSHLYNAKIVYVLAFFEDNTAALSVFNKENMSELDRYENISTFNYACQGIFKFTKKQAKEVLDDMEWIVDTVDKYAESWNDSADDSE